MTWTTRFVARRIPQKLQQVAAQINRSIDTEGRVIASEEADRWSNKVKASGRGGRWNAQMARIETSFSHPKSGALFVRMGWLGNPPMAEDGKTTWFAYWDSGFTLFGKGPYMPGIMAQMDARRNLTRRFNELARDIVDEAERTLGG
jgi:hypothetical protein